MDLYFVSKVMSLLFNMLSRLVIAFLPRRKHLLISWLQSPSAVILEQIGRASCRERVEVVTEFIFLSSKIAVDGDCSHEIKRHLLLGRKAMRN